jgi:hypothetical protein
MKILSQEKISDIKQYDLILELESGKQAQVTVTTTFTGEYETDWKFLTGSKDFTDNEQDEIDTFITAKYY